MQGDNNMIIECDNLVKIYKAADIEVVALQGLDLTVEKGEILAIIGKSGSGKSTLLNIIAGLDKPLAGKIQVDGKDLLKFNGQELKMFNRETIGFVWQNNARNLIPYLTVLQNVELPMLITRKKNRRERAQELLEHVGLMEKCGKRLQELSGGEQQRVAIAIALANTPKIILADEPTGSLDSITAGKVMEVFYRLNHTLGVTVIIVTHDMKIAKMVKRVVAISDGMIGSEMHLKEDYKRKLKELDEEGSKSELHDEYAIVDRKGRIKIPEEFLAGLGIHGGEKLKVKKAANGFEAIKE